MDVDPKIRQVNRSVILTALIPLAIVLLVASFFAMQANRIMESVKAAQNTGHELDLNSQGLRLIGEVEAGLNGYLLTGNTAFVKKDVGAPAGIFATLDQLAPLAKTDELKYIRAIHDDFHRWLEESEGLRQQRGRASRTVEASAVLQARAQMDKVRAEFKAAREIEYARLKAEQQDSLSIMKRVLLSGTLFAILLGVVLSWWLLGRLSKQYQTLIDERGRADRALAQLETITNAAPVAIVYLDREERYVFYNRYYSEHYGRRNLDGRTVREVLGADYANVKMHLDLALSGKISNFEMRIAREDGHTLTVNALYAPTFDARGQVDGIVAISEDVTAKRAFELELQRSREALDFALQSGRMGTWDVDLRTGILHCSKEMLDIWGLTEEEFNGSRETLQKRVHPIDRPRMVQAIDMAVSDGGIYELAYRVQPAPGVERWVLSRGRCLYEATGKTPARFAGVVYDITDTKLAEQELQESKDIAERASMAKTQFLANMSHEIRTPVGAIMGFIDMLKREDYTPDERQGFMAVIERNSQNLLRLIDDILDLSKVEAGKISLEPQSFSLPTFLHDLSAMMTLKASEKGIRFHLRSEGLIPEMVRCDQLRLRQVLSNIIGNAVKFTAHGQVTATLEHEHNQLLISVTDTGIGIAPEGVDRLFQSFGQADASTTRKYGGSGLGLTLAKRLAQAMGGDVVLVHTEIGHGSTFVITVLAPPSQGSRPIKFAEGAFPSGTSAISYPEGGRLQGLNVLLVEDAPDNQMLIETYLRHTGARIEMAEDGNKGFEKALRTRPDVVLMDIQMPNLDGHDATRKLRASGFVQPIIALTAHAMREERDRCLESGCTDYLTKPIQRERLIDALARYSPLGATLEPVSKMP